MQGQPAQQAPAAPQVQTAPAPNQIIYSPRLPTAAELTSVAAAQGVTVEQISQTANQVTVITRNSSGQTNTVAYQLLPTPGMAAPASATIVAPAPTVVTPAPTIVYQQAPQVIYYETREPYWPRYYYRPPVSLHLGFGFSHYSGGGHWGGHRHHRGGFGYRHWR